MLVVLFTEAGQLRKQASERVIRGKAVDEGSTVLHLLEFKRTAFRVRGIGGDDGVVETLGQVYKFGFGGRSVGKVPERAVV